MTRKSKSVEQQFRAIGKRIVDQMAKDAAFRKHLLEDPKAALKAAGFEAEIASLNFPTGGAVAIDCKTTCGYRSCTLTCIGTCYRSCRNATL